ncbi:hypothetical protein E2562_032557 [Oryza meyeriana var. granulata]|uniref:KIB1-4 beta-propeller domain-containing protein n=1 Tax=Oryza meyeriana var. granulata TaxID=110450 RepID=A0A6G1CUN6_9ORYZ|nr:hypothetical protein E2562_032557 [Oryza meyeriana var. granulata]
MTLTARDLSEYLYLRVFLSSDPSDGGGDCIVVLLHRPDGQISFARLGDPHWTWIRTPTGNELYVDVAFRANGRMLYGLRRDGTIHEFDLDGEPALERTTILPAQDCTTRHTNYLVVAAEPRRRLATCVQVYHVPPGATLTSRTLPCVSITNTLHETPCSATEDGSEMMGVPP